MRVAYADPPYVGCGDRYIEQAEVDHLQLIARLVAEFPDGWALSCHSPSLRNLLPVCPEDVRVAAWVKPFAAFRPNLNPAYAWEPVIWRGGRRKRGPDEPTVRDWVSARITFEKGLVGVKPEAFCWWLCDLLGLQPGDELVDLYPGSGIIGLVADRHRAQRALFDLPAGRETE